MIEKIYAAVNDNGQTAQQIAEAVGVTANTTRLYLDKLTDAGRIRFVRKHVAGSAKAKFYTVVH